MPRILHILTEPNDALAQKIIAQQRTKPQNEVEVINLDDDTADYKKLLEKIFAADSIAVW